MRFRSLVTVVVSMLTALAIFAPASHGETDDLTIQINTISPSVLTGNSTITLSGTATNTGTETWTSVHAYMVMPRWPYTSRMQLHDVLTSDFAYVGERIVNTDRFATLGDLAPGESKPFTIRVPSKELGLSAADGVYPVGVHLVATNSRGERDPQGQDRDLTLLPRMSEDSQNVPAGLMWPFIETWSITDANSQEISDSVVSGQLHRYLEAAKKTPTEGRTLLIDPALLDSIEAIAKDAETLKIEPDAAAAMGVWMTDLVALSQKSDTWIIDYARPDYLGFANSKYAQKFTARIDTSTTDAAERHKLVGKKIVWPAASDPTVSLLNYLAGQDPDLVVVSTSQMSDWQATQGSRVVFTGKDTTVPLLAVTPLQFSQSRESTSLFVQHTLSRATLASLERSSATSARSDALTFIDPRWDPKPSDLDALLNQFLGGSDDAFLSPVTASSLSAQNQPAVKIRKTTTAKPFNTQRLSSISQLEDVSTLVADVNLDPESTFSRDHAMERAVSLRWRTQSAKATASISTATSTRKTFLNAISVEAPASITLSGQQGAFPLTMRNGTESPVRVSLDLVADVTGITFDESRAVRIEPGASHTMTVSADMGTQVAATVTAQLASTSGVTFSEPQAFLLRSSNVGQFVWVAMAFAVFLVFAAGIRRFMKKRKAESLKTSETGLREDVPHGK